MSSHASRDMYEFRHQREREYAVGSMKRYYETKQEVVKFFEELTAPFFTEHKEALVLDACCGLGDLTYFLSRAHPQARFVGIDRATFLLDEARQICEGNANITFTEADVLALSQRFEPRTFDLTVCKQTLSWLPDYKEAVREMMAVTKRSIFASSLFYDGRIDYNIRVREYVTEAGRDDYSSFYNIYSLPVFREFCLAHGAKEVAAFDFDIEIDLPAPDDLDRMGTHTLRLESGKRVQVSGALLMPWKIVRIDL
jgi:ubiquinone/menaquinone biosynthesis C-methylase UbiE